MTRRTGLTTLEFLAKRMCKLIVAFTPIIRAIYGENLALMTALESANAACSVLVEEIDKVLPAGT